MLIFQGCVNVGYDCLGLGDVYSNITLIVYGPDATSPVFSSQWAGCTQSSFLFLNGLDATRPVFVSQWAGCNQSVFLFSMGWMQPVCFSFLDGLDATTANQSISLSRLAGSPSRRQRNKKSRQSPSRQQMNKKSRVGPLQEKRKLDWLHPAHRKKKNKLGASSPSRNKNWTGCIRQSQAPKQTPVLLTILMMHPSVTLVFT
jgi:hypothetical protein